MSKDLVVTYLFNVLITPFIDIKIRRATGSRK